MNSAFDSGNIFCKSAADPADVQLEIRPDPFCKHDNTTHFQWFHFRVTGAKGIPLTLKLVNAGKASFPVAWPGVPVSCPTTPAGLAGTLRRGRCCSVSCGTTHLTAALERRLQSLRVLRH